MIRKTTLLSAFALVVMTATTSHAQQKTEATKIDGTYLFTQKIMTAPDSEPIDVQGKLVLTVKGDSVTGTWLLSVPGRENKPSNLRGTMKGSVVTLTSEVSQATLRGGAEERTIDIHQEYVLTVTGDAISGTINSYSSDDNVTLPSRDISGKRATG